MAQIEIKNLTFKYAMADSPCLKSVLTPNGDKAGEVLFENKKIEEVDERTQAMKIGFVMQNPQQQIVTDKVWHELAFGLENMGMAREEIGARIGETAEYFGIAKLVVFTNLKLYLSQKELEEVYKYIMYKKVMVLLLETGDEKECVKNEKILFVDSDYDEIMMYNN